MRCDQCQAEIDDGEEKDHCGRTLCEDCYMDALSPLKPCDPWAVYSATRFIEKQDKGPEFTPAQQQILRLLEKGGPLDPDQLCEKLQIEKADLEREIAMLRHMDKIRGELKEGRRVIRLWNGK